jgi:hypothetical protein
VASSIGQGITQGPCVRARLCLTRGDVWPQGGRGVSDETGPAESHSRAEDVEDRLNQRIRAALDDLEEGRSKLSIGRGSHLIQMSRPDAARRHGGGVQHAIAVAHQVLEGTTCRIVPIPDEIDASVRR